MILAKIMPAWRDFGYFFLYNSALNQEDLDMVGYHTNMVPKLIFLAKRPNFRGTFDFLGVVSEALFKIL